MTNTHPQQLSRRKGMHIDVDACLARRPAAVACDACVEVCPTQALNWADDSVTVESTCMACGRCMAACPSGAITLSGFEALAATPGTTHGELYIECARVPLKLRRAGAVTVPCLGGVTSLDMLNIAARSQAAVLVDRGWCAACPAGRDQTSTLQDIVGDACNDLRTALDGAADRGLLPRIDQVPLPATVAQPPTSATVLGGTALDRRGFFATFRAGASTVVAAASRPRHTRTRAACRPSPVARQHLAARADALATVAKRRSRPLAAAAFPAVTAHRNCCHEGMCAAGCPSGALRLVDDEASGQVGLDIDAALCLACGLCAALCPHGALSVAAAGPATEPWQPGPLALTRHRLRTCTQCADGFIPRDDAELCPRCAMAREQGRNLFGALLTGSARRNTSPTS